MNRVGISRYITNRYACARVDAEIDGTGIEDQQISKEVIVGVKWRTVRFADAKGHSERDVLVRRDNKQDLMSDIKLCWTASTDSETHRIAIAVDLSDSRDLGLHVPALRAGHHKGYGLERSLNNDLAGHIK